MTDTKTKITGALRGLSRPGACELVTFMESSDFFTAPASTKYHLSRAGGLAEHSWNVYRALDSMAPRYLPGMDHDSIVVCGLLHDLCKANFYKTDFRNAKNERGQWERVPYYAIEDQLPLGHGEKSAMMIQRFFPLETDELLAIRWHMGFSEAASYAEQQALNKALGRCRLLRALMLADQVAAFFMEDQ